MHITLTVFLLLLQSTNYLGLEPNIGVTHAFYRVTVTQMSILYIFHKQFRFVTLHVSFCGTYCAESRNKSKKKI